MLSKSGGAAAGAAAAGRKLTDLNAYKSVEQMQHNNTLTVQASSGGRIKTRSVS